MNIKRVKKHIVAALLLVALIMAGCKDQQPQATRQPPTPEVGVLTIQPEPVLLESELPGRISAFRVAEIRPQVNGLIQKRLFTEGAEVSAGDVLYQIDPKPMQAELTNAKAALSRSQANLPALQSRAKRYETLLKEKAVARQDYDDALSALNQAQADIEFYKAAVETASINLAYSEIKAPISGRIGKSNVTEGAIVTAYQAQPLATIQQLDPIYVDVPQSTTDLMHLRQKRANGTLQQTEQGADGVRLFFDDGSEFEQTGTLQFRDVTVDQTTGSVTLRVVFPNPDTVLLPGMFVRAAMKEGINQNGILIPQQSVARDPKGNPVAMVLDQDNTVQQRLLTIDRAIGDKWLVQSGLAKGDQLIVDGLVRVRAGMKVTSTPFEQQSEQQGTAPQQVTSVQQGENGAN